MANSKSNNKMQREKLLQLIEIVSEISKQDGNEWFIDELLKSIGDTASLDYLSKNAVIRNIHEYCIEKVIEDQAREFYKDFPIEKIKEQLVQDFIKMEHERRRGEIVGFGIAMYQQIENIVNHAVGSYFYDHWKKSKEIVVSPYYYDSNLKKHFKLDEDDRHKGTKLKYLIFEDREININKMTAKEKIASFLFLTYYKSFKFNINIIDFKINLNSILDIYYVRNKVHRDYSRKKFDIDYDIDNNKSIHYLLFYGIFNNFYYDVLEFYTNK